jgi:hypothetical protein
MPDTLGPSGCASVASRRLSRRERRRRLFFASVRRTRPRMSFNGGVARVAELQNDAGAVLDPLLGTVALGTGRDLREPGAVAVLGREELTGDHVVTGRAEGTSAVGAGPRSFRCSLCHGGESTSASRRTGDVCLLHTGTPPACELLRAIPKATGL